MLGDVQTGIIVGATISLVYLALVTPGTVSADVRHSFHWYSSILAIKAYGLDQTLLSCIRRSYWPVLVLSVPSCSYGTATMNLVWQGGWRAMEKKGGVVLDHSNGFDFVFPW